MKIRTIDWVVILALATLFLAWPQRGEIMIIADAAKAQAARLSEACS